MNVVLEVAIAIVGTAAFGAAVQTILSKPKVQQAQQVAAGIARVGRQALPIIDTVWALYGPAKYPVAAILRTAVELAGEVAEVDSPEKFEKLLGWVEREFSPTIAAQHAAQVETIAPLAWAMGQRVGEALERG